MPARCCLIGWNVKKPLKSIAAGAPASEVGNASAGMLGEVVKGKAWQIP